MKVYLDPNTRHYFERNREICKRLLDEIPKAEFHTVRNIDKKPIIERMKACEQVLTNQSAPSVSAAEKNKIYKQYKELREDLKGTMQSKRFMHPTTTIDGRRVANMEQARENAEKLVKTWGIEKEKVRTMKNLGTIIDPDDPKIRDVESLRRR